MFNARIDGHTEGWTYTKFRIVSNFIKNLINPCKCMKIGSQLSLGTTASNCSMDGDYCFADLVQNILMAKNAKFSYNNTHCKKWLLFILSLSLASLS